jgi:hypothetical protein
VSVNLLSDSMVQDFSPDDDGSTFISIFGTQPKYYSAKPSTISTVLTSP